MRNQFIFSLMAMLLSSFSIISCGHKTADSHDPQPLSDQQALETQKHVNRFFHSEVIPKIKESWNAMADSGKTVTYHYQYRRNHDRWEFNQMDKMESDLSGHSDTIAMLFMAKAVAGTHFPIEKRMEQDTIFNLYWSWPVPFPEGEFDPLTGEFMARQNNGGASGGCDGRGTRAHCTYCGKNGDCPLVCVGYNECNNTGGACWELYECASGGPFGKFSTNVMR